MPRHKKFTPTVISKIASLVDQGYSTEQIAERVGCTVGTLRVRCSQFGISLRKRKTNHSKPSRSGLAQGNLQHTQFGISLPQPTVDRLRQAASLRGTSEWILAAALLEAIAQDDLYQAVLGET